MVFCFSLLLMQNEFITTEWTIRTMGSEYILEKKCNETSEIAFLFAPAGAIPNRPMIVLLLER